VLLLEPKLPIVVLRHAIHGAASATGMSLLKSVQAREQAWKRSRHWVEDESASDEDKQTG